jgi:hypothetical protein
MNIKTLSGACAWKGENIATDSRWQFTLDATDFVELDEALVHAKSLGCDIRSIGRSQFPLGHLLGKLEVISRELEEGCGFVRLKGMPLNRWSSQDLELIWMGLASHLGVPVYQNAQGQLIRPITAEQGDVGDRYGQLETDSGQFLSSRARTASNAELRFHTDRCDIVALLCTGQAETGGDSRIASSVTVHNEMLERAPELCEKLYEDLPRSRIGEEQGGESAWYNLPVWGVENNKFTSHYSRTYVEALEYVAGAPVVSDVQWKAMDMLAELADKNALSMCLDPGDIQFLNNHVIYHSRGHYQDNPDKGMVRSLTRIWLSSPQRVLPKNHKVLWGEVESGKIRGGIKQSIAA